MLPNTAYNFLEKSYVKNIEGTNKDKKMLGQTSDGKVDLIYAKLVEPHKKLKIINKRVLRGGTK